MFGLIKPCGHVLGPELWRVWMTHLCGVCLCLRDRHGHLARTATNVDTVLVSVLTAAQRPELAATRPAGPCVLRGLKCGSVVRGDAPAAQFAAGVSMILAGGVLRDHAADRDLSRPVRPLAKAVGRRWENGGREDLEVLGLEAGALAGIVDRQVDLEQRCAGTGPAQGTGGAGLTAVLAPTEEAVSAALARTATLADRPENAAPLADLGRLLGRVTHLADAVLDQEEDERLARWNPLTATGTSPGTAVRLIEEALGEVEPTYDRLVLPGGRNGAPPEASQQADLARTLLVEVLPGSAHRILGHAGWCVGVCSGQHGTQHLSSSGRRTRRHRLRKKLDGCGDCCVSCGDCPCDRCCSCDGCCCCCCDG